MSVPMPSQALKVKYHYLSSANPGSHYLHWNQEAPLNCRVFHSTSGPREEPLWYFSKMVVLPSPTILQKPWWGPPQVHHYKRRAVYIWTFTSVFPSPWFFGLFSFTNIREFPSYFHLAETRSQSIYLEGTLKPESLGSALKSTDLGLFIYILFSLN